MKRNKCFVSLHSVLKIIINMYNWLVALDIIYLIECYMELMNFVASYCTLTIPDRCTVLYK